MDRRDEPEAACAQRDRAAGRRDGDRAAGSDPARHGRQQAGQRARMNKLDHTGLVHTDPADPDEAVTDSAAAATAFATGVKTFNGGVGVDPQGRPVRTLLEDARRAGKATGLVTTSQVTDATPAAYGAHVSDRAQQSEIAKQFLEGSKPDVILGGGEDYWFPPGDAGGHPDHPATDPTEAEQGRSRQPRRPGTAARLPLRQGPCRAARRARAQAARPVRQRGDVRAPRRARATSTTRWCRCPRWRPRRSTSCPATATGFSS